MPLKTDYKKFYSIYNNQNTRYKTRETIERDTLVLLHWIFAILKFLLKEEFKTPYLNIPPGFLFDTIIV